MIRFCLSVFLSSLIIAGLGSADLTALDDHATGVYPSTLALGTALSPSVFSPLTEAARIRGEGATEASPRAVIYVRYKGYKCSHCIRQLAYLNEHADALKRLGVQVVAFSADDARTSDKMIHAAGLRTDVIRVFSDPDNAVAASIGAVRVDADSVLDLHAALVVRNGVLTFAAFTDQPFMDIERLIGTATDRSAPDGSTPHGQGAASGQGLRSYDGGFNVRTIATATDGVREPKDLDFNTSPLHPNDLWVVMAEPSGHAMLIIHDADQPTQVIRRKKDSRAQHFMWRTQALSFGVNGTFATGQNGEPGGVDMDYRFMGPTLWSSDTSIFASKYQDDQSMLASHLDMLHQNAYCLGIAHQHDNVYWVSDALHGTIGRYDFRDPHEVGGTDHRDGIIRQYTTATLQSNERGRAAHIAFDADKRWLYYINPSANSILRLDTRTGIETRPLTPSPESDENLASFTEFTGSTVEPVVQLTKDVRPVGLTIDGTTMLVGNTDGTILVYDIKSNPPALKQTLNVFPYVVGAVTIAPDGKIWFADPVNATINVLDPDVKETLKAKDFVRVTRTHKEMSMDFGIVRPNCDVATYKLTAAAPTGWTISVPDSTTITATQTPGFSVSAMPDSTAAAGYLTVRAIETKSGSVLTSSVLISRSDLRRIIVNDATTETFDIVEAVAQTSRTGYTAMTSDLFLQLVDSMPDIQTVVWNSGSFGEINMAEDIAMGSVMANGAELMVIADDPLLLRTDIPGSTGFFDQFGVKLVGADVPTGTDDGKRVFQGVPGDPVTGGMSGVDCELPRLDHTRGGFFVPNVKLALNKPKSISILLRSGGTITSAVRFETPVYRSVLCGINLSRFLDESERNTFLDKSIVWLEQAETPLPDPTDVAMPTDTRQSGLVQVVGPNPFTDGTRLRLTLSTPAADVGLYSIAGQRIATLWQGAVDGSLDVDVDGLAISNGMYYVIVRDGSTSSHCTIVKHL